MNQLRFSDEEYLLVSLQELQELLNCMPNLNRYMNYYLFTTLRLPLTSNNTRLFYGLHRTPEGTAGETFLEDMRMLLSRLPLLQMIKVYNFIVYISLNKNNRNLSHMVSVYNY